MQTSGPFGTHPALTAAPEHPTEAARWAAEAGFEVTHTKIEAPHDDRFPPRTREAATSEPFSAGGSLLATAPWGRTGAPSRRVVPRGGCGGGRWAAWGRGY